MVRDLLVNARRGISHPNTDLDAQTFVLRVQQVRQAAGAARALGVSYRPQVSEAELSDSQVLVWDIGREYDPLRGNFDHHQDHRLGATPIILCQALGVEATPLDRYVDLVDRGHFFKQPQSHPFAETLQGLAAGINLTYGDDRDRSVEFQALLGWVDAHQLDPFDRFDEALLPTRFHVCLSAIRRDQALAHGAARDARWQDTGIGRVAVLTTDLIGAMRVLYDQGAAVVLLHEPGARFAGWRRPGTKYTIGVNPAAVAIPEELDLRPLFAELSRREPTRNRWGGQAGIGGSPREDGGSGLTLQQVVQAVQQYLA